MPRQSFSTSRRPWPPMLYCGRKDCSRYGEPQRGDYETVYWDVLCHTCQRPLLIEHDWKLLESGKWVPRWA
jgi:hypothetical protein